MLNCSTPVTLLWSHQFSGYASPQGGNRVIEGPRPFSDLLEGFGHRLKDLGRPGSDKAKAPCVRPGPVVRYGDGRGSDRRKKWYTSHAEVVFLDLDDGETDPEEVHETLDLAGLEHAVWETASSTTARVRVRVAVPLDPGSQYPGDRAYAASCLTLASLLGVEDSVDRAGLRLGQVMALPTRRKLDGQEPRTWYSPGLPLTVTAEDMAAHAPAPRVHEHRTLDDQDDARREFNERFGPDGDGLEALGAEYGDVMGCTYRREGSHWRWVGADGTEASMPNIAASDTEGAYVDYAATSPLCGRVVFAWDLLVHQAALHQEGLDVLDDEQYVEACQRYGDPALQPIRARIAEEETGRLLEQFDTLSSGGPACSAQPLTDRFQDVPSLGRALTQSAVALAGGDPKRVERYQSWNEQGHARVIAAASRALGGVERGARDTVPYVRQEDGSHVPLEQVRTRLVSAVLDEACDSGAYWPSSGGVRAVDMALDLLVTRPSRCVDPYQAVYLEAAAPYEGQGHPEVCRGRLLEAWDEHLGPQCLVPGVSDPTPLDRHYWRTTLLAAAARTRFPGVRVDFMPIVVGSQASGKTTFGQRLSLDGRPGMRVGRLSAAMFRNGGSDNEMGVLYRKALPSLFAVVDEMDKVAVIPSASEALKDFISEQDAYFAGKYVAFPSRYPKRFVPMGLSNSRHVVPAADGWRRYGVLRFEPRDSGPGPRYLTELLQDEGRMVRLHGLAWAMVGLWAEEARAAGEDPVVSVGRRLTAPSDPGGELYEEHRARVLQHMAYPSARAALVAELRAGDGRVRLGGCYGHAKVVSVLQASGSYARSVSWETVADGVVSAMGGELAAGGYVMPDELPPAMVHEVSMFDSSV